MTAAALKTTLAVLAASMMVACASPRGNTLPAGQAPGPSVQLVSQGWHAGIVIRRSDIPAGIWPESDEFPDADYLEVGWGDWDYYQMPDAGWGIVLKAGLLPSRSVLHVVGFRGPPAAYFAGKEMVDIKLSQAGFERLCAYLHDSHARGADGVRARPLGPSLYGQGRFYASGDRYHLFNTCNVWTARALRAAGCPITPAFTITVDQLMSRAAKIDCYNERAE